MKGAEIKKQLGAQCLERVGHDWRLAYVFTANDSPGVKFGGPMLEWSWSVREARSLYRFSHREEGTEENKQSRENKKNVQGENGKGEEELESDAGSHEVVTLE